MAEYRVEITICEPDEAVAIALLEALERDCRDAGPVMVDHRAAAAFEYVLGTDARNAVEACAHLGDRFARAMRVVGLSPDAIVGVHGQAVPAADLDDLAPADPLQPV